MIIGKEIMPINKIYDYLHNLRVNTHRRNFLIQRRRVEKGNGSKTLGWILSDENEKELTQCIKFNDILDYKRKIENA